jgi:hypothetical protein
MANVFSPICIITWNHLSDKEYISESGGPRQANKYQALTGCIRNKEHVYGGSEIPMMNGGKLDSLTTAINDIIRQFMSEAGTKLKG